MQLERDLARAGIKPFAWIVNQTLTPLHVTDPVLRARRAHETRHLTELVEHAAHLALEPWLADPRVSSDGTLAAHGLATSFDGTAGRLESLPGPADVLCAALCACILENVERFSHMLPFRYESASIEVTAEREEPPPRIVRIHYRLRVVTDEPAARVELLHKNIHKFGTITNTLGAACDLTGEIEAVAAGGAP